MYLIIACLKTSHTDKLGHHRQTSSDIHAALEVQGETLKRIHQDTDILRRLHPDVDVPISVVGISQTGPSKISEKSTAPQRSRMSQYIPHPLVPKYSRTAYSNTSKPSSFYEGTICAVDEEYMYIETTESSSKFKTLGSLIKKKSSKQSKAPSIMSSPKEFIKPEEIYELFQLIQQRHSLDREIYALQHIRKEERHIVRRKMAAADAILERIQRVTMTMSDPGKFKSEAEYRGFQEFKRRLSSGEARHWSSDPLWEEDRIS